MTEHLLELIDQIHDYFMRDPNLDHEKELLYRHVKLSEEFGELSNDIMSYLGHQREEKLQQFDKTSLGYEVVDVVICALLVGKMVDIDLEQAFSEKIIKIKERRNNFEN